MIRNHALIKSFLLDAWFIDPAYADLMLPGVIEMLEGKDVQSNLQTHEKQQPTLLSADDSVSRLSINSSGELSGFADAPAGSAAIIPIRGAITKYDGYCNYGVESYMRWFDDAERAGSVSEIIVLIDSPGGQANCAFMLSQRIAAATKPVIAYVDSGMAASAAYLIASAAKQIWVNTPVDMIGSIGAMFSLASSKTPEGIKTWDIYSRLSTEKNLGFRRLKENNDTSLLEDMLDENVKFFIEAVKSNRGDRLNLSEADPFKGATYTAAKALKIGLIDGIGSLPEAITSLRKGAGNISGKIMLETQELTTEHTQTEQIDMKSSFKQRLVAWLTENDEEVTADTTEATVTAEETTTVTAETTSVVEPTMEERIAALEANLVTVTNENKALKANKPAAEATAVVVAEEKVPSPVEATHEVTSFFSETDEMVKKMKAGIA